MPCIDCNGGEAEEDSDSGVWGADERGDAREGGSERESMSPREDGREGERVNLRRLGLPLLAAALVLGLELLVAVQLLLEDALPLLLLLASSRSV